MKKHILCFGDSNTYGYNAITDSRFTEEERFPCLLGNDLGEEYLVVEEGLPGRTTCFEDPIHEGLSGLSYLYPCLMSHAPVDLLIIMLGTNDTKERFSSSPECIALGLNRLIQKAKTTDCWPQSGPNILVVAPKNIEKAYETTPCFATMGKDCAEKSAGVPQAFAIQAEACGCHFYDANQAVTANNTIDFMHLTEEGHRQLAQALSKKVREIM